MTAPGRSNRILSEVGRITVISRAIPLAGVFLCAVLLSACGGGSGSDGDADNGGSGEAPVSSGSRQVRGAAVKGPLQGATINFYEFTTDGQPDGATLATTTTDNSGNFNISLPAGTPNVLVAASGGGFYDESDPASLRFIVWSTSVELFGFLPAGQNQAAITPVADSLVRKSWRDAANGLSFNHSVSENRQQAILALGFDPAGVIPPNPISPPPGASSEQLRYALMLGGLAHAVNTAALQVGLAAADFEVLLAVLQDWEDCLLDGAHFGAPLFANGQPLPANKLDHEIERFRNNNYDKYKNVALKTINAELCVNELPIARNDSADTDEDVAVNIHIVDNDEDFDGSLVAGSLEIIEQPSHGKVSINVAGGYIRYTPDANYFGNDSFRYRLKDNLGARTNTARVGINIADVNDPPVARNDARAVQEDSNPVSINVLANDDDIDGSIDPSTLVITKAPSHGDHGINSAFRIVYEPHDDYNGSDEIRYRVRDDDGALSNTAIVSITVGASNDAPVISIIDDAVIDEDDEYGPVVFNVDDVDHSPASLSVSASSSNTSLLPDAGIELAGADENRTIKATPVADASGSTNITVRVMDGNGLQAETTFTLDVEPVNDAPMAVDDSFQVETDGFFSTLPSECTECPPDLLSNGNSSVRDNDIDIDDDRESLGIAVNSGPSHGSLFMDTDGRFEYIPDESYVGNDSFTYTVSDAEPLSDTGTVNIVVFEPESCVQPPEDMQSWHTGDSEHTVGGDGVFAQDIEGSHDAAMLNDATSGIVNGMVHESMLFDGYAAVAEISDHPDLRPAHITIDAWVRLDTFENNWENSTQTIVTKLQGASESNPESYYLGTGHEDDFVFGGFDEFGQSVFASTANADTEFNIQAGESSPWYHVAGTFDGNRFRIYVNGELMDVQPPLNDEASAGPLYYGSSPGSQPVYIGGNTSNANPTACFEGFAPCYMFSGQIDEVEIFDRALSLSEIQAIHDAGEHGKCRPAR